MKRIKIAKADILVEWYFPLVSVYLCVMMLCVMLCGCVCVCGIVCVVCDVVCVCD